MDIIIDGYNLLKSTPIEKDLQRITGFPDIEGGRIYLLDTLADYKKKKGHNIKVIFDGWSRGGLSEFKEKYKGVMVIFSKRGETADTLIMRMLKENRPGRLVVSSDQELIDFARGKNVNYISAGDFYHKVFISEESDEEEDEDSSAKPKLSSRKKGNPKRPAKKVRQTKKVMKKI